MTEMQEPQWQRVDTATWDMNRGEVLLWKKEWIDEDFNPHGICVGYFQVGVPDMGIEEHFKIAGFDPNNCGRCITHPSNWPTHWRPHVQPPGVDGVE